MQKFCEVFYGDRKIKQDTLLASNPNPNPNPIP